MVVALSSAQMYHDFNLFGTITPNQKMTPGMATRHEWKRSLKWLDKFKGIETMTEHEREEVIRAMERGTGSLYLHQWLKIESYSSNNL